MTSPDGGQVITQYSGLTTSITKHDLNGEYADQTITQIKDGLGREIQVIDEAGQSLYKSYDANDNLVQTVAPTTTSGANTTVLTYDKRGRKIAMNDPDMGNWTYAYDALGQLRKQTDAKGQITQMSYDLLGRMASRSEPEGVTSWTYDTAVNGVGKLAAVSGPNGFQQTLSYDGYGRPQSEARTLAGTTLSTSTVYDSYSRPQRLNYPGGFAIQYNYNADG